MDNQGIHKYKFAPNKKFLNEFAEYVLSFHPDFPTMNEDQQKKWLVKNTNACGHSLNERRRYIAGRIKGAIIEYCTKWKGKTWESMPAWEEILRCAKREVDLTVFDYLEYDNDGSPIGDQVEIENPTWQQVLEKSADGQLMAWYIDRVVAMAMGRDMFGTNIRNHATISEAKAWFDGT